MNKIKIAGALVFALSIILALLSTSIAKQNRENSSNLNFINEQKAFRFQNLYFTPTEMERTTLKV